ncbi:BHLH domain-containing protein [Mycena kentingensis (nom. inval.)]|nr:BHLH domain-containing protein [Mycena kentingensis (nom. inval.)]
MDSQFYAHDIDHAQIPQQMPAQLPGPDHQFPYQPGSAVPTVNLDLSSLSNLLNIALISGSQQPGISLESDQRERVAPFHGLPTPGNSTELRATPSVEYVSPMILDYNDTFSQPFVTPRGSTSAPAHIAFQTTRNELDFDISPLTSPWLGAHPQPINAQPQPTSQTRPATKRVAASSSDEDAAAIASARPSRKKQSPAIRPAVPVPQRRGSTSRSKSATSTPLLRSTRTRKGSVNVPGDTPSPVDLSMPPPAPPAEHTLPSSPLTQASPGLGPQLTPVTPASIMNLGRLGINTSGNGKASTKQPKSAGASTSSFKAILPQSAIPSTSRLPAAPPKKTSHKAAEQKRRDSLKTTFDDLRTLLPPIPLPGDTNGDEPVLPGALPPRGPPKAGGEGPNKGVSKLQLLMCGNDYIRQLHGRVQRRDDEIGKLRREVARLRGIVNGDPVGLLADDEVEEPVDLEKDLDAVELGHMLGRIATIMDEDEEDD